MHTRRFRLRRRSRRFRACVYSWKILLNVVLSYSDRAIRIASLLTHIKDRTSRNIPGLVRKFAGPSRSFRGTICQVRDRGLPSLAPPFGERGVPLRFSLG